MCGWFEYTHNTQNNYTAFDSMYAYVEVFMLQKKFLSNVFMHFLHCFRNTSPLETEPLQERLKPVTPPADTGLAGAKQHVTLVL